MTDTNAEEVTRKGIKRELPVKLETHEMLMIAIAKSKAEAELDEMEAELRDIKADWNQRIDEQERRIAVMGVEIRTSEQKRVVPCYERFRAGTIEVVREDTHEIIERRAASLAEAQKALPGTDVADAAATQKAANVEEDEDGDVVVPEGNGRKSKARR